MAAEGFGEMSTAYAAFVKNLGQIWGGSARCGDFGVLLPVGCISGLMGVGTFWLDGLRVTMLGQRPIYTFSHGARTLYYTPLWFLACMLSATVNFAVQVYEPTMWAAFLAAVMWRTLLRQALPAPEDQQSMDDG
jgi:hypothetical protein